MGEDHTQDRDWFDAVPKRLIAALFSLLVVVGSSLGASTVSLLMARWDSVEAAASDPLKDRVAKVEERLTVNETRVKQHEDLIKALDMRQQLSEVQSDVKVINAKLNLMNERIMRKVN